MDTIREDVLRNLYLAAELGQNAREKVKIYEGQISAYNDRIDALNQQIAIYKSKEGDYEDKIQAKEAEIVNLNKAVAILEKQIADLNKDLVKQKKKTRGVAIAGLAGMIIALVTGLLLGN
jgi:chromosome segregation ATPase